MALKHWFGIVLAAGLVAGCVNKPKEAAAPAVIPATGETINDIRAEYVKSNPNALVGLVEVVHADTLWAAVSNAPVQDFKLNDSVVFIDTAGATLTTGVVRNIVGDSLHVQYVAPEDGKRAPAKGDLAVRVK